MKRIWHAAIFLLVVAGLYVLGIDPSQLSRDMATRSGGGPDIVEPGPPAGTAGFQKIHGESIDRTWRAAVVGVTDGDTIKVLDASNQEHRIRLAGIDAPERSQAFGQASKQYLSDLVFDRTIDVFQTDVDRYGRTVAYLGLNGMDVNGEMVAAGYAWEYAQYSRSSTLGGYQEEAMIARRGLWAGRSPQDRIPPWEFRKR